MASPKYQPDTTYEVIFARPVKHGPFKYLPRDTAQMTGAVLTEVEAENGDDCVRSAIPR